MRKYRIPISTEPELYIFVAIILLLVPLKWVLAVIVCCALHELGHLSSAKFLRIPIQRIRFGLRGTCIHMPPMLPWQELICSAAGPLSGLIPLLFYRTFPEAALCAVFLTIYNLFPIDPSDGMRILRCILLFIFGNHTAAKLTTIVATTLCIIIFVLGFIGTFILHLGILPIASVIFLALCRKREKMP